MADNDPDHEKDNSGRDDSRSSGAQRGPLIAVGVVVLLVVVGVVLAHELSASSRLQDCLMSGRTNCAPINSSP